MLKEIGAAGLGLGLATSPLALSRSSTYDGREGKIRVAAVQFSPQLGDVDANLEMAEHWVRFAFREGARWVVLPEFFTSGMLFNSDRVLDAHRPLSGAPSQLLRTLAKDGNAIVAGTFLAQSGDHVYNTMLIATPDGGTYTHDKDFPSGEVESSFYAGGEDFEFVAELRRNGAATLDEQIPSRKGNVQNGVFSLANGMAIGSAICWEQIRYRTARRLRGSVDAIIAASAWPILDADVGLPGVDTEMLRNEMSIGRTSIKEMPRRLARLVGAPVIHANLVGETWGYISGEGKVPVLARFLGESQVVDAHGHVLASRPYSEGDGLAIADIEPARIKPSEQIPQEKFWTPDFTDFCKTLWNQGGASGRNYYLTKARPHRNRK